MEIGKTVKIHENIPEVIPVTLPKKLPPTVNPQKTEKPIPVPNWPQPSKVPERVER